MFERVVKLVTTDRTRTWRLDQAARSIFLTEFMSAFFLAMRYFFKPKATLNIRLRRVALTPLSRRACAATLSEWRGAASPASCARRSARRRPLRSRRGRDATTARGEPRDSTSHDEMHLLRLLSGGLPGRRHRPGTEFATETPEEELYYNKERLLANGDRWERAIAKNISLDAPYRRAPQSVASAGGLRWGRHRRGMKVWAWPEELSR
jgi:NADH-quinone oxidoreductase subunit I